MALTAPRLRALHRAEDIGSALKGGVNVCQRQLVNEVLGFLVTEFVRNFGREGATPIQRGPNASLFGRVQAIKLIRPNALPDIWSRAPAQFVYDIIEMTDCILEAINSSTQAYISALMGRFCPSISHDRL